MTSRLRVGVIFGGRSGEHEVSLKSARTVMDALDHSKYDVVPIGITKEGTWVLSGDPMRILMEGTPSDRDLLAGRNEALVPAVGLDSLHQRPLDVVIPMVHGTNGEDGTIQGLLELARIPYIGAGVLASAVGMDKAIMKAVFRQHGLKVVPWIVLLRRRWRNEPGEVRAEIRQLGYPCFVKPANLGSSVGISKVHDESELTAALSLAAEFDRKIIVEQAVDKAREIEVSVLGNDDPIASVPGEIISSNEFYDYSAKYLDEGSQLIIPANLAPDDVERVQQLAIAAFTAVDCSGMARVDCLATPDASEIYLNEINTIPGFTHISMYPKLWEASGLSISDLLDKLIDLALERQKDRSSSRTSYR